MTDYATGFSQGQREGARFALDAQADATQALAGRLTAVPEAIAAANEATAILRDAARRLDYEPAASRGEEVPRPAEMAPESPQGRPERARAADTDRREAEAEAEAPRTRARSRARG